MNENENENEPPADMPPWLRQVLDSQATFLQAAIETLRNENKEAVRGANRPNGEEDCKCHSIQNSVLMDVRCLANYS